ncbi:uncharacterized protein BDR25DRAFT_212634 [Lindgomyces ingoldianus]|uniref:Uncharacterized protein n=1 Tax=Lindgomyces ingoldianus TaxID=673940 RepID=A0ACB6RCS8_9PLEO|nr:uncharacterized protein BDR25DRAFT_212634 [Lindgomyces ingoldianus]KAF2476135.1 hypothetical protein BDR25DRAFT_212634 [Lindgomyces ingoldianus]
MLFLIAFLLTVRYAASSSVETTAWTSAPNFRGTWDLLVSCVLTLTICVWSALHLNVPTEDSTLAQRNLRRTRWILLGIFAPELVVSTAFAQYLTARWLRREILEDLKYRKAEGAKLNTPPEQQLQEWGITQCYFAVMGGITIQAGEGFDGSPRLSLTPEGVRLLSFLGRLPWISESQVRDKSKADGLAKSIVCLQAGWMLLQIIARLIQQLPVTLLEINTIGHVLCALVLYLLWWSKPLEVKDPALISREDWMDPFLSLMWMCSPISSSKDGITEMRCMAYIPQSQRRVASVPTITVDQDDAVSGSALSPHETHFSIGSIAARDPRKFIGPLGDFRVGSHESSPSPSPFDHHVSYMIREKELKTAPEHEIFFTLQEPHHGLQHSRKYCRRALQDCLRHDPLSPFAIQRWRLACTLIDDLYNQCQDRPSYMDFYFTTSTLGIFVGEPKYIDRYIPDFIGLSYIGQTGVHKDRLKSALSFAAAAYGALHVAAWNEYFPTRTERILWILSSMAIGSSGIFLWLYFLAKESIESLDVFATRFRSNKVLSIIGRFVLGLFILARIYLVVEAFVSLRRVPIAVFQTPEWSNFLPHL